MLRFADFPPHLRLLLLASGAPAGGRPARGLAPAPDSDAALQPDTPAQMAARILEQVDWTEIDWDKFVLACERHRVSSLVWQTLGRLDPSPVPDPVRAALQRRAMHNAFLALRSATETGRVVQRFAEDGIELKVLKGVALSQRLYGSPNARNVGDIDLLTTQPDPAAQIELMTSLGYGLINPTTRLTPRRIASFLRFWKDFTFHSPAARTDLDLHWRLFNNRFHPANRLLETGSFTTETVFGVAMRVLAPEDQFLYVTAHGISDSFTYFKSLADVAGFLRLLTPAELDRALAKAKTLGLLPQISAAVHLASDWMQIPVASRALLGADDPLAVAVRSRVSALLRAQEFLPDRDFPSPASWLRLETQIVPGPRSLLEMARRFVWRPRVWSSVDLPDSLFWLYPVLGLLLPPRLHSAELAGHSHAAPRTPLESPNAAGRIGVSKSPPNV